MNLIIFIILGYIFSILECTLISIFPSMLKPDLLLITTLYLATSFGFKKGSFLSLYFGYLKGIFSGRWIGVNIFLYTTIFVISHSINRQFYFREGFSQSIYLIIFSIFHNLLFVLILKFVTPTTNTIYFEILKWILPIAILNMFFGYLIFPILKKLDIAKEKELSKTIY